MHAGRPPQPRPAGRRVTVALSTASSYPESTAAAFESAARLGYDGVELMVWADPVSQDVDTVRRLVDYHGIPVVSVHAPCLLMTQRVWDPDPWERLRRAIAAAEQLDAGVVVVHPPFRWQRSYARGFSDGLARLAARTPVRIAVENMFPLRLPGRDLMPYSSDPDPSLADHPHVTLDLSHTAISGVDALRLVERLGSRLAHVHMADGVGTGRDEHLVPGRGGQPCAQLLRELPRSGYTGCVVVEISTRSAAGPEERQADLAEALEFTRRHLPVDGPTERAGVAR